MATTKVTALSAPELRPVAESVARERTETWVLSRRAHCDKRLHLPDGSGDATSLCGLLTANTREVGVEAYPPGYRSVCQSCRLVISMGMDDPPRRDQPIETARPAKHTCTTCGGPKQGDDCPFCQEFDEVIGG